MPLFTKAPLVSDTVTVLTLLDGLDGTAVVRHLYEHYGTVIAGSRTKLQGKVIRIGTMGACTDDDVREDLLYLEKTLEDLGWPIETGVAVEAASEILLQA